MSGSTASSSTTGSKVSIFAAKSGFVIPKNKLLGSLVPASKGGKKPGGSDATNEESTTQASRKTKWGPDPTQDAAVRKGRALAYQTRVEQIMQQLKSGILKPGGTQDSQVADQHANPMLSGSQTESKDLELLKLEWREIIGEILKLNPSYKAPPDYEPLLKEATVPIPIKDHPGFNFVGLIFGPGSETKKRLEKETGAKIQVRGTKANTGEKVEISPSGETDPSVTYEELNVHVLADTFEKVDGAIALIDLLITSASEAPTVPTSDQGSGQSTIVTAQTPQQGGFQYQFPGVLPQASGYPPSFILIQNSCAPVHSSSVPVHSSPVNPIIMPPLSGPRPVPASGFNPILQNTSPLPPRQQLPMQVPTYPYQPRNFPMQTSQPPSAQANNLASLPFTGNQVSPALPSPAAGTFASSLPQSVRPLIPVGSSSGWPTASTGGVAPSLGNAGQMLPPVVSFQGPPRLVPQPGLQSSNLPAVNVVPSVSLPSAPSTFNFPMNQPNGPSRFAPVPPRQMGSSSMPVPGSMPLLSPAASTAQPASQSATIGSFPVRAVNPTPGRPPLVSPIPRHSGPSDFTFQRHHPPNPASQLVPGPNSQSVAQDGRFPRPMPPSSPQASPFRLGVPLPSPHNQMGQTQAHMPPVPFAGTPNPPRVLAMSNTIPMLPPTLSFSPASQLPNSAGPFPPRQANQVQGQHNHQAPITLRGNFNAPNQQSSSNFLFAPSSGGQQIYDPFSPS